MASSEQRGFAVVTGGSNGIGPALAREFVATALGVFLARGLGQTTGAPLSGVKG
jgi:NADP-dependent 3-hydroxy acid dehydrogenase YdfG